MKKVLALCLIVLLGAGGSVYAGESNPFQLSVLNPLQIVPEENSISGLRLNLLYSDNKDMSGLTLASGWTKTRGDVKGLGLSAVHWTDGSAYGWQTGLFNYVGMRSVGLEFGAVNVIKGDMSGIQLGILNMNEGFVHGLQWGLWNYVTGRFIGLQSGIINVDKGDFSGYQSGIVNYVSGVVTGLQVGLWNDAKQMDGVQIGLINATGSLDNGLQFGLANYNGNGDPLECMIVVNWSF